MREFWIVLDVFKQPVTAFSYESTAQTFIDFEGKGMTIMKVSQVENKPELVQTIPKVLQDYADKFYKSQRR